MWFPKAVFDKFHQVLRLGSLREADQILVNVLEHAAKQSGAPKACPHCHKNLVNQTLPYLELFVHACPEKHGFWMSPENSAGLKKLISEQISLQIPGKSKFHLLRSFLIGFAAVLALHLACPIFKNLKALNQNWLNQRENEKIGAGYWPTRNQSYFAEISAKESTLGNAEELLYFENWADLMMETISNRMNMEGVLQTRRPLEEYQMILSVYLQKQSMALEKLAALSTPEKLRGFQDHVLSGLKKQMRFYAAFALEKIHDPSIDLAKMLKHPDLIASSRELQAAGSLVLELYPSMDGPTRAAIERRLNWADITFNFHLPAPAPQEPKD